MYYLCGHHNIRYFAAIRFEKDMNERAKRPFFVHILIYGRFARR